jgi:extracellular solute-binding protein
MWAATVVQPVATGEVEIAVATVPIVLREPGVELVGRLPTELQHYLVCTGGVGAVAQDAEAAKALLKFLMAPAAVSEPQGPGGRCTLMQAARVGGLSERVGGCGDTIYAHACALGAEGIVSKRRYRPYRSGREVSQGRPARGSVFPESSPAVCRATV